MRNFDIRLDEAVRSQTLAGSAAQTWGRSVVYSLAVYSSVGLADDVTGAVSIQLNDCASVRNDPLLRPCLEFVAQSPNSV